MGMSNILRNSPDHGFFYERVGRAMKPFLEQDIDLRQAQRLASEKVASEMLEEGVDRSKVESLLNESIRTSKIGERVSNLGVPLSADLLTLMMTALAGVEFSTPELLLEYKVEIIKEFVMYMYTNEGKHQGLPHLTVVLKGKIINISISESPKILAGPKKVRGLGKVLKAISLHHEALIAEWDSHRPDDQRLENSKRRQTNRSKPNNG
jgi:hypothetical protein